jgi:hypothetical protein
LDAHIDLTIDRWECGLGEALRRRNALRSQNVGLRDGKNAGENGYCF